MAEEEVRYHMLRPAQIVARRKACPVAYLPIGNLEWHGEHNPVGTDTLQAEALAILCARKGGGLAFPPLWYGESRLTRATETRSPQRWNCRLRTSTPTASPSPRPNRPSTTTNSCSTSWPNSRLWASRWGSSSPATTRS